MAEGVFPLVELAVQVFVERGLRHAVVAPGSRSAPLTVALASHPALTLHVVYDERSAGYVALGLAQQLRQPVALVCTSGTAAVNFGPAVVEAFYQQIPLLVLTADRPPEWIDQQDNQAIHQNGLYGPHVRFSGVLPLDDGHPDTSWHATRLACEAMEALQGLLPGPAHLNVPLREPLYPLPGYRHNFGRAARLPTLLSSSPQLEPAEWQPLLAQWHTAQRKLVVLGMLPTDPELHRALRLLQRDPAVALFADITANCWPHVAPLVHVDMALGTRDPATLQALAPDLVLYLGGQVTYKYLKLLLRSHPPEQLWRVQPAGTLPDTYQQTTVRVPMQPAAFLSALAEQARPGADGYARRWQQAEQQARLALFDLLEEGPFGEFQAVHRLFDLLPDASLLQIGNSMPIRYANFAGIRAGHVPAQINANRGTSGIDGCVSTAVGAARATTAPTTLLVGDLAFFYDRNGLWQRELPPNLRIVLLNNHGGGIFDLLEGPSRLDDAVRTQYFLTPQPLNARRTAQDHGLRYTAVSEAHALAPALAALYADSGPALLEIESDMATNRAVFADFRARAAGLRLTLSGETLHATQ